MDFENRKFRYKGGYNKYIKRFIDFFLALFLVVLLLPFYLIIAFLIVLDDGFPIFYKPYRGGFHNKKFRIFKFRTMVKNADKIGGGTTALNDPRITKVGKWLRKTKLDEIPQMINVLIGTMSFVGPRPELLKYTSRYSGDELKIFEVRPGITDYSSLKFISLDEEVGEINVDYVYENKILKTKNELRIKYANEVSFFVDFKIFFKTVTYVLKKVKFLLKNNC